MTTIIFVTGMEETGMDTIIDMVLKGSRKKMSNPKHIRFKGVIPETSARGATDAAKKAAEKFRSTVEKDVSNSLKAGMNVVVEGPLTLKTAMGYIPLVPRDFFESFSPDVIILFELPPNSPAGIDWKQQEINRAYASMYASLTGAALKVIEVGRDRVKDAIRDSTRVMVSVLGEG